MTTMKKLIVIATAIFAVFSANAQKIDGRTTLINGNQNFQINVGGTGIFINGDAVFGGEVGVVYNYKRLRVEGNYAYAKNGDVDRSFANVGIGCCLVGNPNVKVRPYLVATIGGASQSAYSCYGTDIKGSTSNADVQLEFVHLYKTYDWNLQASLKFQVDFVLSKTVTLSAYASGIYNPQEGARKNAKLGEVNFEELPGQHWEVNVQELDNYLKATKFGVSAGVKIAFRF